MPAVDHERVLVKLRAHIASKASHGRDQLLRELAQIEFDCQVPEGLEGFDATPLRPSRRADEANSDGDTSQEDGTTSHLAAAG